MKINTFLTSFPCSIELLQYAHIVELHIWVPLLRQHNRYGEQSPQPSSVLRPDAVLVYVRSQSWSPSFALVARLAEHFFNLTTLRVLSMN